jgi:Protein of unknown function (DUF1614)
MRRPKNSLLARVLDQLDQVIAEHHLARRDRHRLARDECLGARRRCAGEQAPPVAGTFGTLVGADLLNLPRVRSLQAPMVSIGAAANAVQPA